MTQIDNEGTIEIDFNNKCIKGKTKAGRWKKHFENLQKLIEKEI